MKKQGYRYHRMIRAMVHIIKLPKKLRLEVPPDAFVIECDLSGVDKRYMAFALSCMPLPDMRRFLPSPPLKYHESVTKRFSGGFVVDSLPKSFDTIKNPGRAFFKGEVFSLHGPVSIIRQEEIRE